MVMKILWITNTIFPAPSRILGLQEPVMGGWMYHLAEQIAISPNIKLVVATVYQEKETKHFDIDNIDYYLLPTRSSVDYQKHLETHWQSLCDKLQPDIVHIHGTEYIHGLACMRACPHLNYIVSIQGLVSVIARTYYAGINVTEILKNITFRDIVRFDTLFMQKRKFIVRGEFEKEYIQRTQHVIGRTSWDYAHTKAINPVVNYHFCNDILRACFYTAIKWDITKKIDYTIFLSQGSYPIKGLHQVLKAVALLKNEFPQVKIRVAGHDITNAATLKNKIKISGYGAYIKKLIKQLELNNQVQFTGTLTETQMITEYLNAHLFICPSSIENSPNSLGEAQILGVPVIASYVGGIPDMVTHGETGFLYPFDEFEMLAEYIRKLFANNTIAQRISANGIKMAEQRHNSKINLNRNLEIYQQLVK
jgi:glycosyltransferase involved in cell wall biosynthesis